MKKFLAIYLGSPESAAFKQWQAMPEAKHKERMRSLNDKPYLDGDRFTAGDLMMTTVLRILRHADIVTGHKRLADNIERCTARPAFKRAFDAQIADFKMAA